MRNAFADEFKSLAAENDKLILLSGDIGNRMFDSFRERFPDRFYNCGVAEANMVSMAAGLASCGFLPVCYTIAPFMTYRCMEQIRVDLCYHNLPVVFVGTGAGLSYASLGATHHSLEDVGMLRLLSNMRVLCPGDSNELRGLLKEAFNNPAPTYMRIGKKGEEVINPDGVQLKIGQANILKDGEETAIVTMGNTLALGRDLHSELCEKGETPALISWHTMAPTPKEAIEQVFKRFSKIITIEEHNINGGLSSLFLENRPQGNQSRIISFGTSHHFEHRTFHSQKEARDFMGLSFEKIKTDVEKALS